ncbi:MAG TPA: hypothetical protein VFU22_11660 [Roseiflexaceae bacterium]|nr:hypothetical protein [Roseiflexaceae bacterium]
MSGPSTFLHLGDRIVTRHMLGSISPGCCGTIVTVFHSAPGFYEVLLDKSNVRHVIDTAEFDRLDSGTNRADSR